MSDEYARDRESTKEFSPEERAQIREIVRALRFRVKFWQTVGVWVKWIFWVVAGMVSVKILLADWLRGFLK